MGITAGSSHPGARPDDPDDFYAYVGCVDCGRWVIKARTATIEARCETCWRAFTGSTYNGTPHGAWYPVIPRVERT